MSEESDESPRVNRRTVIKGGIAVGGALWAAPVVQALSVTKASAATASGGGGSSPPPPPPPPPPPGGSGISYVILVLDDGGQVVTMKVDTDGSVSCPAKASNDAGSDTLYANYLSANHWSPSTSKSCPALPVTSTNGGHTLSVALDGQTKLLGFMVHDGSLHGTANPPTGSLVRFCAGTTLPSGAYTGYPTGWSVPSGPSGLGATVTFVKP